MFKILSIFACMFLIVNGYYDYNYDYRYKYDYNDHYNENIYEQLNDESLVSEKRFSDDDLVCRDEITGEPLDWITLYKLPRKSRVSETSMVYNKFIYEGTAYTYMTSKDQEWQMSDLSMNDTNSFAGRTLDILYRTYYKQELNQTTDSKLGYILYNDQADKVSITRGHTKGVILFNEKSAIWIVHSIPHFPPKPSDSKYQIHKSQCVYGQQFFCMSVKPEDLDKIGEQFKYTYPQVYDYHIPESVKNSAYLENLSKVVKGEHVKSMPWSNLLEFETIGGEKLLSFAKFTDFEDDLYSGLVAPTLENNLNTETWNNGRGTLESNCSSKIEYQVHNIEQINFKTMGVRFSVHHDHSKWAVTTNKRSDRETKDESKQVACIGDINRQEEQFKRAGGTVCFLNNEKVWNQYTKLVDQIEPCKRIFSTNDKIEKLTEKKRVPMVQTKQNSNYLNLVNRIKRKSQGKTFKADNSMDQLTMLNNWNKFKIKFQ